MGRYGMGGPRSPPDNARVISKLGRGSPTGVAVYQHQTYPEKYHEAFFVLDWTFGRVIAVYPHVSETSEGANTGGRFMAETFMQQRERLVSPLPISASNPMGVC